MVIIKMIIFLALFVFGTVNGQTAIGFDITTKATTATTAWPDIYLGHKKHFTDYMNDYINDDFWNATIWALEEEFQKSCHKGKIEHVYKIRDYVIHNGVTNKTYATYYDSVHDGLKNGIILIKHDFS